MDHNNFARETLIHAHWKILKIYQLEAKSF